MTKKLKIKPLPTKAILHELFEYDFETGILTWKDGPNVGEEAGYTTSQGYRKVGIHPKHTGLKKRTEFYVHRLVFYMFISECDHCVVDHIDGDKQNNRLTNLRAVKQSVNRKNTFAQRAKGKIPNPPKKARYFS